MKQLTVVGLSLLMVGCVGRTIPLPVIAKPAPEPTKVVEVPLAPPEPVKPVLAIAGDVQTLSAWQQFRGELLGLNASQRESLAKQLTKSENAVTNLQLLLLRLHPENPYPVRLKAQGQLAELVAKLPVDLANLLRWDLAYNQRLLESESALKALTRLNGQQEDNLEKLQKQNADLQKKIEALTQIEAKLGSGGG